MKTKEHNVVSDKAKRVIKRSHLHYSRWREMCKRCNDPLHPSYSKYGGLGIEIDWGWSPNNPDGLANFNMWLEIQIRSNPQISKPRMTRRDKKGHYNAENCYITTSAVIGQNKAGVVLSEELVIQLRRFKKDHPDTSVPKIAKHFNLPTRNISLALTGVNWKSVDCIELPVSG